MKFVVSLLLLSSVAARRKRKCHLEGNCPKIEDHEKPINIYDYSDEQQELFTRLFFEEASRWYDLPDSKLRTDWMRYMRGDAKQEMKMMKDELYKEGGAWD